MANGFSQQDMQDLQDIKAKLPPDHPMRAKIDSAMGANAGEFQTAPGAPVKSAGDPTMSHSGPLQHSYAKADPSTRPDNSIGGVLKTVLPEAASATSATLTGGGLMTAPAETALAAGRSMAGGYLGNKAGRFAARELGGGDTAQNIAGGVTGTVGAIGLPMMGDRIPLRQIAGEMASKVSPTIGKMITPSPSSAPMMPSAPPPEEGVTLVPEPRKPFEGEQPGLMGSVPREELSDLAQNRKPGAAKQLQQIGKKIIYQPNPVIGRR